MAEKYTTMGDLLGATQAVADRHAEAHQMHTEAAEAAGSIERPADSWDGPEDAEIDG